MKDVARLAGVSSQTVSRVANNSSEVKPETRLRVERAMEELGYRPNYAARALKHGSFKDVGVVLFNMTSYGDSHILNGVVDAAREHGYATTIRSFEQGCPATLQSAIDQMKTLPVDGVVFILVLVGYVLAKGHRNVYHIAGPSYSVAAQSRRRGWEDALRQQGIVPPSVYIGDWEADSGYQAGLALAHERDCTAVYAANDQMAYGCILGLREAGKRVPEDVSVVGVDDSLQGIVPRLELTTMREKFNELGREAFGMILAQCNGDKLPVGVKTVIPSVLVERGSVSEVEDRGA